MKKKELIIKKVLAAALSAAMVLSMAACGNEDGGSSSSGSDAQQGQAAALPVDQLFDLPGLHAQSFQLSVKLDIRRLRSPSMISAEECSGSDLTTT